MIRRRTRTTPEILAIALLCTLVPIIARAATGRIVVSLEGNLPAGVPPSLTIEGSIHEDAVLIGAVAIASGSVRFENLPPGLYRIAVEGIASEGDRLPPIEVGVAPGATAALAYDLPTGRITPIPFRPDPFGLDTAWDDGWLAILPSNGEQRLLRDGSGGPRIRSATIEGIDASGTGFRHGLRLGSGGVAGAWIDPIGAAPASHEGAVRSVYARTIGNVAELEAATGTAERTSWDGILSRSLPETAPWDPRLFLAARLLRHLDAAPGVFTDERLPHNGIDGLDLLSRIDMRPSARTRLAGIVYGEGAIQKHFLESYRLDPRHGPREERAALQAAARIDHSPAPDRLLLGEISFKRTYLAVGDGVYFDDLRSYARRENADPAAGGLYWGPGHVYDHFLRRVQVDWGARFESWWDPGTETARGAGLHLRRGTYRSYEHAKPTLTWLGDDGGYVPVQSIGYTKQGDAHTDAQGREAGHPIVLSGFGSARRPIGGGEIEVGLRGTHYRPGRDPIRTLSDPLGGDEALDPEDLGSERTATTLDPRVGYTLPLGARARFWLTAGSETRVPPSEAVYLSPLYLEQAAFLAGDNIERSNPIFGNPGLRPERVWMASAGLGVTLGKGLSVRATAHGMQVRDAITARSFPVGHDSLVFYLNDGTRDAIGLATRADWQPSRRLRIRATYDLSRARTETIEPALLDAAWYEPHLPVRDSENSEGLPPVLPSHDDGRDRDAFPSDQDRRHRISVAAAVRPPGDLLGDVGRPILADLEIGIATLLASGRPFTWTEPYAAGLLDSPPPEPAAGFSRNSGRMPWTWQVDLRVARTVRLFGVEARAWFEATNLLNRKNVVGVYQSTGEADDDGWLDTPEASRDLYRSRLQDENNYDDPRLFRFGLRLRLP